MKMALWEIRRWVLECCVISAVIALTWLMVSLNNTVLKLQAAAARGEQREVERLEIVKQMLRKQEGH